MGFGYFFNVMKRITFLIKMFCPIFTGLLLAISFPDYEFALLAWVALVPLFLIIIQKDQKFSFFLSYLSGIIFFLVIFDWILEATGYTWLHHTLLILYLGLYVAVFGKVINVMARRLGVAWSLAAAPFFWVALEFVRSNFFFLALPWGLLAHSQYEIPAALQIAAFTGVYGVSFLIVLVNAAITALILRMGLRRPVPLTFGSSFLSTRTAFCLLGAAAIFTGSTLSYGYAVINRPLRTVPLKVSIVQGNIDQNKKWNRKYARHILQTYRDLTLKASRDNPDLIVWPETATPGSINRNLSLYGQLQSIAREAGTYILVGSAQQQKFDGQDAKKKENYYNSAFLIHATGGRQHYNKIRLFPFGEYLPLKGIMPWSMISVPEIGGYIPGEEFTVFNHPAGKFGVTICWENLFPDFVRQFTKRGAKFIINLTNEAWFGESMAPNQFLSMSVMRAVENRVSVIRSANTGISGFIDPYGRIFGRVENDQRKAVFVRGFLTREVPVVAAKTFYTKHGDIFVYVCVIISIFILAVLSLRPARRLILK